MASLSFDLIILDEAHKARSRQAYGPDAGEPNELLAFIRSAALRSDHVLLGTATPIQTRAEDLWDLVRVLHEGSDGFVLGNDLAPWHTPDRVLPILSGSEQVNDVDNGWQLLRSPLPTLESTNEPNARRLFRNLREDLGLRRTQHLAGALTELSVDLRDDLEMEFERVIDGASFFQRENPFVRHVVLRKRHTLEERELIAKIAVNIHPEEGLVKEPHAFNALFQGLALRTTPDFDRAYTEARNFGKVLAKRGKGSGFMKNLMEQRVCSSVVAGISTAKTLLEGRTVHEDTDEVEGELALQNEDERQALMRLITSLETMTADPKMMAIRHFLVDEGWLELGCIIFSQYYDTARWIADSLADMFPDETIGLYAGADRSRLYRDGLAVFIERETLKKMVADHEIRIMVATDAACEGLNLQTLGSLINVDLPWNPTRLEQRIGRIKRFGQSRTAVDMLNLVHQGTVDEKVYERLSERMRNRYDLFGGLPDTIKDEWIDDLETLGEKMDQYIEERRQATGFDLRYNDTVQPSDDMWRDCAKVLARRDLETLMRQGWGASGRSQLGDGKE